MSRGRRFFWSLTSGLAAMALLLYGPGIARTPGFALTALVAAFVTYFAVDRGLRWAGEGTR